MSDRISDSAPLYALVIVVGGLVLAIASVYGALSLVGVL